MKDLKGNKKRVRESIVEGIFYPKEEKDLRETIQKLLDESSQPEGEAFAIITPHAALDYAGRSLACAYKAVKKRRLKNIIIIAPEHREPTEQIILPESEYFQTPLGLVPVNQSIVEELLGCSNIIIKNDIPHLEEHCIEVQLPFIQVLFNNIPVTPILMGKSKNKNTKILSNALQLLFRDRYDETLFIVTTNIASSFRKKNTKNKADLFINLIQEGNWEGILHNLASKKIKPCGGDCVAALLAFSNIRYNIGVLHQTNSAEINEESQSIVYYAAIALNRLE